MNKILVKIDDDKRYIKRYNTDKLDNYNRIYSVGSFPPKFVRQYLSINEEVFEGTPTEYNIESKTEDNIIIKFNSKLDTKYRLDLIMEPETQIWHIGFSEWNKELNNTNDYENLTNKNEAIDVFSRLIWILKDLNMNVEYCIGSSADSRKNNIYEYMMRFVSNWEKRNTEQYTLGWAIYFNL